MARADPARSHYCATRHLLRNLENARALHRNPLARDAFADVAAPAALRAISGRVDAALRAVDARELVTLLRVDVHRHDPQRVAADLGLSARQFYRMRRRAHERFFAAYSVSGPRSISAAEPQAPQLLARAAGLRDSGEISSAVAILDDIASSGIEPAIQVQALMQLAEAEAWAHRLERARRHLASAASLLAIAPIPHERRALLEDTYEAVSLSLRWFAEGPAAVSHANGKPHDTSAVSHGRATLVRAAAALRSGEAAYALRLLRQLDAGSIGLQSPEAVVDLLMLKGELEDFTADDPLLSETLFERAAEHARSHGLRGRELYAIHQLSLTRWANSRDARARSAYRAHVDRIDPSLPARLRSYLMFSAADVELAIGHPRRALAAAQAAAGVSTNRYESFSARGLAAGALLRLGSLAQAGVQATLAADAARAEGHARVLSLAQRISAQAHLAQGNRRAARAAIDESIECARHFASVHALAQTQAVLGRIIGR